MCKYSVKSIKARLAKADFEAANVQKTINHEMKRVADANDKANCLYKGWSRLSSHPHFSLKHPDMTFHHLGCVAVPLEQIFLRLRRRHRTR